MARIAKIVDDWFGVGRANSTIRREVRGGLTTFLTMTYILIVNPSILGAAIAIEGVDKVSLTAQLMSATAIAAAFGSLLMGVLARYPFALAPGMGLNAYFAYTVVLGQGIDWRVALGAVFVSGLIFLVLSTAGVRTAILHAIPAELRVATGAGIGMFLALLGAKSAGLVVSDQATIVTLGDVGSPGVLLCAGGVVVTAVLMARNVTGAILFGILAVTATAIATGAEVYPEESAFAGFDGSLVRMPVWPADLFLALDISGALGFGLIGIVLTFTVVDLLDTSGTLMGLGDKAGVVDEKGEMPRASQAFSADAVATSVGALLGTSTTTSYIESAAGVEAGGRTGLTAVVVAVLFLCSLFAWPIVAAVPAVASAPALIVVGAMMMSELSRIQWSDARRGLPAFLIVIGIPLTFSIANGISIGILAHVAVNALGGRARAVSPVMYGLAALLLARFIWLGMG